MIRLKYYPRIYSKIKNIDLLGKSIDEAFAPMSINILLEDEIDITGDMIVRENNVPEVGQDLEVLVT